MHLRLWLTGSPHCQTWGSPPGGQMPSGGGEGDTVSKRTMSRPCWMLRIFILETEEDQKERGKYCFFGFAKSKWNSMDVPPVLASTGADIKGLTQLHCVPETSFPRPLWNQKWKEEPESAGCPQHGFLHRSSRAAQDAFYLTGRKNGSVAKSSELSAERRQCQATLDETAEQNRQKTVRTGLGPEQSRAPKHQRRSGCCPHKDRGARISSTPLCISRPQPFRHQGRKLWTTISPHVGRGRWFQDDSHKGCTA